ncbi:MAG: CHAT domain-containing protein [Rhizobacter sp.]|nr:CHAT domain-containing protein [Rhizobacter sp.]
MGPLWRAGLISCLLAATVPASRLAMAQTTPESVAPTGALANALARQRDAQNVLVLTDEGKALFERDAIKLDGYTYCGRAVALAEQGEFRQSIRAASKALHLGDAADNDDLKAVAQRDLAIAYSYAGLLDDAERYANAALVLPVKDTQQVYAPAHKIIGDVFARRGRHAEAEAAYRRSLELASERFRPLVLVSLANAYTASGRAAEALMQLDRLPAGETAKLGAYLVRSRANALLGVGEHDAALALFRQIAAAGSAADAQYQQLWATEGTGRVLLAKGQRVEALAAYLETVRLADNLRGKFQSDEFKTGLFSDVQKVFDTALALSIEARDFEAAWVLSEASRSRQLLDSIRQRASDRLADQRVTLAQLQQRLGADEAVLQFHVLADRSVAWLIRRGSLSSALLPVGRAALAADVEQFRSSVIERRRNTVNLAQGLYKSVLGELDLSGLQRVFVVPHGPLHYLPFQALHDGKSYLIERSALAVWPSAAVGAALLVRANLPAENLLGFGNPSSDRNVALPGAEREVQKVARLFDRSEVYVQDEATKRRFTLEAAKAGVVHVAAHAELDEVDPMFSRILFASSAAEPGLLEAREIFGLQLDKVRLITLSACESGLGTVAKGDEIMGFTRSFLSAGASSIVASLWPVADDATEMLMSRLYAELAAGRDLMLGMQAAQTEVLRTRRFVHPFFWAPFNVIGNGRLQVGAAARQG